jgi:hypothetical protein
MRVSGVCALDVNDLIRAQDFHHIEAGLVPSGPRYDHKGYTCLFAGRRLGKSLLARSLDKDG